MRSIFSAYELDMSTPLVRIPMLVCELPGCRATVGQKTDSYGHRRDIDVDTDTFIAQYRLLEDMRRVL